MADDQVQLNEFPVKFKQLRIIELTTSSTTRSRFFSTLDVNKMQQATSPLAWRKTKNSSTNSP
jgi:hypothetical protein